MTYIITQPCVDVKDLACVEECPVDCIYEGNRMLYIQPDECVDCGACEPVCPVEAIYSEDDVPDDQKGYIALNAELARILKQGYALDNEEREEGLHCIGAPIFDYRGDVVAAVSASGPVTLLDDALLPRVVEKVKAAACKISLRLGYVR
mgnify:CR=1 FL=1